LAACEGRAREGLRDRDGLLEVMRKGKEEKSRWKGGMERAEGGEGKGRQGNRVSTI
jgi:hypothetical protein